MQPIDGVSVTEAICQVQSKLSIVIISDEAKELILEVVSVLKNRVNVNAVRLVAFLGTLNPMTVAIHGATACRLNGIAKTQIPRRMVGVAIARRRSGKTFHSTNGSVSEGD